MFDHTFGSWSAPARPALAALFTLALLAPLGAMAQQTTQAGCMQDLAGFNLGCTANDVQVAQATNIVILDDGCAFPGDTVTFEATFEVVLTAQERHDVGLYFAVDGDLNGDGAISGTCSVSTPAFAPDPPWLDLDGVNDGGFCANDPALSCTVDRDCKAVGGNCALTQDTCGDIDSNHNPLYPVIQITTACIDPDGNGTLNLPNCTSWRQPGANELCLSPTDAFPGAPSKCNCDLGFEVDIDVPAAPITVTKTASVASVNEPGDVVTFTVDVSNGSPFAALTVSSLTDDVYGDITTAGGDIVSTNCAVPFTLAFGQSSSCTFDAWVGGLGDTTHVDVVTATGSDENGNPVIGSNDASVDIVDLLPSMTLVKTATPTEVLEPGDFVTFDVLVTNTSAADDILIDSLVDDIHGDLNGQGTCVAPISLAVGASYACSFDAFVGGAPGTAETDTITAIGSDDEGNPVLASDSATVNINDVPSAIEVMKSASPTSVPEPGGTVAFTFTVNNLSGVDTVTLSSLVDSVHGDLAGAGSCSVPQILAPGASYTCTASFFVPGNAGDLETNVVTASGSDDDGNPVNDTDSATVNVTDVAPTASLTKVAASAIVTYDVVVTNDSSAEALDLDSLLDDQFGDVTAVQGDVVSTTCAVPQLIPVGGSYACSFEGLVESSPHVNTVTGSVSDDDGNTIAPSDSATVTLD